MPNEDVTHYHCRHTLMREREREESIIIYYHLPLNLILRESSGMRDERGM